MELEPSAMALLATWLLNNGAAFGAGVLIGSVSTGIVILTKLRREGIL